MKRSQRLLLDRKTEFHSSPQRQNWY